MVDLEAITSDLSLDDLLNWTVCSVTFLQHFTGAPRAADPSKDACAGFFHSALLYIVYTYFVFNVWFLFFGIMCNYAVIYIYNLYIL